MLKYNIILYNYSVIFNIVACYATKDVVRIGNPFYYNPQLHVITITQLFSYAVLSLHSLQTLLRP
jgi:hypothetical protein